MDLKQKVMTGAVAGAIAFVAAWEGRSLVAYLDPVGIPTICEGYTHGVKMGDIATPARCDELTAKEVLKAMRTVDASVNRPLPDPVRIALASFVYNVGAGAFNGSTLARKLRAGDIRGACNELPAGCTPRGNASKGWKKTSSGAIVMPFKAQLIALIVALGLATAAVLAWHWNGNARYEEGVADIQSKYRMAELEAVQAESERLAAISVSLDARLQELAQQQPKIIERYTREIVDRPLPDVCILDTGRLQRINEAISAPTLPVDLSRPCPEIPMLQTNSWDDLAQQHIKLTRLYGECRAKHGAIIEAFEMP